MAHSGTKAGTNVLMLGPAPRPAAVPDFSSIIPSELAATFEMDEPKSATRLWDLHASLHCSIIGTCLTTADLRQVLNKAGFLGIEHASDHELHAKAVALCCKRQDASKLLHKALDRKHRSTINRFSSAKESGQVRALWDSYLEKGEIPGAYWAVVTHSHADEDLVRHVFGDVHMLSHLVGASNRADIRRLRQLEEENAALHEKAQRQETCLRETIAERDETIRDLRAALEDALVTRSVENSSQSALEAGIEGAATGVTADLDQKLKRQAGRLAERLDAITHELADLKEECSHWRLRSLELEAELEAADRCLSSGDGGARRSKNDLSGKTLLYVGGRANQVPQLKRLAEEFGAAFLHHDGGVEDNSHSLASLAARADAVLFPVDCISHRAVITVKRVCGQLGKTYFPLRSSGLTSFAGLIQRLDLTAG